MKKRQTQAEAKKEQKSAKGVGVWTHEEEAKLTLAVNKFPAGTSNRWKVIADYIGRNPKETIAKAKEMQDRKQKNVEAKRQQEADMKAKREAIKQEMKAKAKADQENKKKVVEKASDPNAWTNE